MGFEELALRLIVLAIVGFGLLLFIVGIVIGVAL